MLLAVALAVRGPRLGHVHVDLARIRDTAAVDAEEPSTSPRWPGPRREAWIARVGASPLRAPPATAPGRGRGVRPLRLVGSWLYLDRYWAEEVDVARALRAMAATGAAGVDEAGLARRPRRVCSEPTRPAASPGAAAAAVTAPPLGRGRRPGHRQDDDGGADRGPASASRPPRRAALAAVALAAPTGKAAARLEEAVHAEAPRSTSPRRPDAAARPAALTMHRLLGLAARQQQPLSP